MRTWAKSEHRMSETRRFTPAPMLCSILLAMSAPTALARQAPGNSDLWPAMESPVGLDPDIESRIDDLLGQMTVEQKVGQVIQAEIQFVKPDEVRDYHLGSVLNGGGSFPGKDKRASAADWVALADAFYHASMDTSDGGMAIPVIWGTDAMHGHSNVYGATLFPHNIGLGAARNPELIRKIGEITSQEVAVTGIPWTFAPTVAVARDDRWGRTYESYSEDPDIVRQYAGQMVKGIQGVAGSEDFLGSRRLLSTAKHFLGDGGTWEGQDQGDNQAAESDLVEIHAAGYLSALEAGVQTIMISFNSWQGVKMHGNPTLLTGALKERMGFDGLLVGDWDGHAQVEGCDSESCPAAINAGLDLFMAPEKWKGLWYNTLGQVRSGEIPMERLDDAVRRILRVKLRYGLFERGAPSTWPLSGRTELMGSDRHRAIARQAVRESLVLLKNNGQLLPLSPKAHVLVTGPGADDIGMQTGGWTLSWQGTGNKNSDFPGATSIFAGIAQTVESAGGTAELSGDGSYEEKPDVAIVVWGESPYAEFQGDLRHIQFQPGNTADLDLLRRLKQAGIPVVSVFLSGRPLWVNPHLNSSDAFVAAWLPGSEGGGVADLLFRKADGALNHDFTGRLSYSWPASVDQTVLNVHSEPYDPLFEYGYGLSVFSETTVAGDLNEQGIEIEVLSDLEVFVNRLQEPWQLLAASADDLNLPGNAWDVYPIDDLGQQKAGFPQVVKAQHRVQEDALKIRWEGGYAGFVGLVQDFHSIDSFKENDLSEYVFSDGSWKFNLMLKSGDPKTITFGMGCSIPEGCEAEMRLDELVSEDRDLGQWRSVEIELQCLSRLGMNFTRMSTPFYLKTDQAAEVLVSNIHIVAGDGKSAPPNCDAKEFME